MANLSGLRTEAVSAGGQSNDTGVQRLSDIVARLCAEVERIEKVAHDAMDEARRARRSANR